MRNAALALVLGLLATNSAAAAPVDEAALDRACLQALKAWDVPGCAVVIVKGDRVFYLKGHGLRDLDARTPVTPDTVFPLASCTKAFTTAVLAMLVDEGRLSWDDPVRKHLPWFHLADPLADGQVMIRDLVTHRTGLRSHDLLWYKAPWPPEDAVRRAGRLPLDGPFRGVFQYQSTMFTAAGLAAGRAAGSSWEDLVRRRIFEPLGMAHATTVYPAGDAYERPTPYRHRSPGEADPLPWYELTRPDAAGTVHASARDLAPWLSLQIGNGSYKGRRLVSAQNLAETHRPQVALRLEGLEQRTHPETNLMSYGLGWVIQDYRGRLLVSHAGILDGFRAHVTLLPRDGWALAVLSNLHQTRMNLALSNRLVDLLLGLPDKDWNGLLTAVVKEDQAQARDRFEKRMAARQPDTHPSRGLEAYAGTYEHPAYGSARVEWDGRRLRWHWSSFQGRLDHFHHDTFVLDHEFLGYPFVTFAPNEAGPVASMHVGGLLDVTFTRVPSPSSLP